MTEWTQWRGPIAPPGPAELADRYAASQLVKVYALGVDMRDLDTVFSVFAPDAFGRLKAIFEEDLALYGEPGLDMIHTRDPRLLEFLLSDAVLDLVEPVVGPDIGLWASHFISKPPRTGKATPWHEDSSYWNGRVSTMAGICTVWLAIDEATPENGCMKVIPGTQNNGFSEFTPAARVTAGKIADRARAFAVPAREVDGNDVTEVWQAAGEAVARAREGGGPSFIEARTYRIQGHFEAESFVLSGGRYREEAEIERWRGADPIARYRGRLTAAGTASAAELDAIDAAVAGQVADAARFAESGRPADPELAQTLMFAPEEA